MKSNTLTFNELFNDLHKILTDLLETSEKRDFYSCILEIRERGEHSSLFAKLDGRYLDDLKTINAIRNILIHKNDWIEITPSTIKTVKALIQGIKQIEANFHKKALEIFWKKIYTARDTETLADVIDAMASKNFSHVPVYSDTGVFRWVFSLKSLVLWMRNQKFLIDKHILLKDIIIDTKQSEYLFIPSQTPISQIDRYFMEYSESRKKLGAIFLTQSWDPMDPIEGIITPWDLPLVYLNNL